MNDPDTSSLIVGGYWREIQYFSYLTVPKAGHFVPNNYYIPSLQFFTDYINNKALQCHDTTNGCSVVDFRCQQMN